MSYRPLPPCLTIKPSGIEGLGLFAKEHIRADTDLGILHHLDLGEEAIVQTPLGGFINHSDEPNCRKHIHKNTYRLITMRAIAPGEELTLSYTLYKI